MVLNRFNDGAFIYSCDSFDAVEQMGEMEERRNGLGQDMDGSLFLPDK